MSGTRPPNPNWTTPGWTIPVWAPNANYPAGSDPWSANPCKVVHPGAASVGFTPDSGAAAENFNQLFFDAYSTDDASKTWAVAHKNEAQTFAQALLDYVGQCPALNFRNAAVGGLSGISRLIFCAGTLKWYGFSGGTCTAIRTADVRTWPTVNEIGAGAQINNYNANADVDPSGNIVIPGSGVTDGDKIAEFNNGTLTWTKRTGLFAPALLFTDVAYDPPSGLWCVVGKKNGSNALDVYTSPDRVTWTRRTAPTPTFDATIGPSATIVSDGNGTLLMRCAYNPANGAAAANNVVGFSKSTDGGITWSAVVNVATPFTDPTLSAKDYRPKWTGAEWICTDSNNATKKTYVMTSPDGVTWTIVATLTTAWIYQVATLGELIVGMYGDGTFSGRVAFSLDAGVTWKATDETVNGAAIYAGAGRFLLSVNTGQIYVGPGTGLGVKTLT